ncbi:MAG: hypothetical protein KDD48_06380 [Bdellovibrionales bacterium]|nr:hypothetical protein [Bdellovibrionales bacterium]
MISGISTAFGQNASFEVLNRMSDTHKNTFGLFSHDGGLKIYNTISGETSNHIAFSASFLEGMTRNYGDFRFDRTIEKSIQAKLSKRDPFGNLLFSGMDFSDSYQDIEKLNGLENINFYRQMTVSLFNGIERNLSPHLRFSIYSGFSTCHYSDQGSVSFLPLGGFSLSHQTKNTLIKMDLSQRVESTGENSGLYGSQTRKEARLSSLFHISKRLNIAANCLISIMDSNFAQDDLPNRAGMMIASLDINYSFNDHLAATTTIAHKSFVRNQYVRNNPEGITANIAINYAIF